MVYSKLYGCIPAEKGRKASLFLAWPSWSRKCCGLKECGVSHIVSSRRTEFRVAITTVPCGRNYGNKEIRWDDFKIKVELIMTLY